MSDPNGFDPANPNKKPPEDEYQKWLHGFNPSQMPAYQGATGADGNLAPGYLLNAGKEVGFDAGVADSPWMKMLQGQNDTQTMQQLDALNSSNNSGAAMAMSNLAAHGGASAGAISNIASAAGRDRASGQQGVRASGAMNSMNLLNGGIQQQAALDTQNRQYKTGVDQANIQTLLANNQGQNQYNLGKYNTTAAAWGADRAATAQENSKGSCWIISELARHAQLPADQAELMTRYKQYVLGHDLDGARFYIRRCEPLIGMMIEGDFDWKLLEGWNTALCTLLRSNMLEAAYVLFRNTLVTLIEKYWPECDDESFKRMQLRKAAREADKPELPPVKLTKKDAALGVKCLQNLSPEQFKKEA